MPIHNDKTISRFWKHVDVRGPDECWPWLGHRLPKGYGTFRTGRWKTNRAHVVSFEIATGLPGKPCVLHSCDNPPCCNDKHLWRGTNQDNVDDKMAKGRHNCGRGDGCGRSKLNSSQVMQIREHIAEGMTNRAIGKMFNVTDANISAIRRGKTWKSLPEVSAA